MTYQVKITKVDTGETRLATGGSVWHPWSKSWWTEGNGSCDCNRGDVWTEAGGEEPGEDDYDCGHEQFHVSHAILPDGRVEEIDGELE